MPKFAELWVYLSAMPLFGLTAVAAPSGIAPALGTLAGCRAGGRRGSALLLRWALGLPAEVILSLVPKSVTAPVAMGIAE
jgi:putative effector of murein hydrolase